MIFTPLDFIIQWLSKQWDKLMDVRKEDKGVFVVYLLGLSSVFLIIPGYWLASWVLNIDIFSLERESLRVYIAISIIGVLFYFIGGALSVYYYRQALKNKGK